MEQLLVVGDKVEFDLPFAPVSVKRRGDKGSVKYEKISATKISFTGLKAGMTAYLFVDSDARTPDVLIEVNVKPLIDFRDRDPDRTVENVMEILRLAGEDNFEDTKLMYEESKDPAPPAVPDPANDFLAE